MRYIKRKSLLYKSKVEYADWAINHVQGCAHDCRFPCYAYNQARYSGRVQNHADWRDVAIVSNALELLDKEIPKYKDRIKEVHLCFVTDPFMYDIEAIGLIPEVKNMTLAIMRKLNEVGIKVTTLTKGYYPNQEIIDMQYANMNEYGITVVSLEDDFRDMYEPGSAHPEDRVGSLEVLYQASLETWVSIEPYPTPNIDPSSNLDKLLKEISFANRIVFGKTNYNKAIKEWPEWKQFYNDCATKVVEFCKARRIEYWIKEGTANDGQ